MPHVARNTIFGFVPIISLAIFMMPAALAQNAASANPDSSTFDPDGTAHITRVVPMPKTVSPEAQQWLKEIEYEGPSDEGLGSTARGHRRMA
jgi:hypothetical protein